MLLKFKYVYRVCVCLQATVAHMEDTKNTISMHQITQQILQKPIQVD